MAEVVVVETAGCSEEASVEGEGSLCVCSRHWRSNKRGSVGECWGVLKC